MANTKENEEMNADLSVDELKSVTGGFGGSGNLGGGVGGGGGFGQSGQSIPTRYRFRDKHNDYQEKELEEFYL